MFLGYISEWRLEVSKAVSLSEKILDRWVQASFLDRWVQASFQEGPTEMLRALLAHTTHAPTKVRRWARGTCLSPYSLIAGKRGLCSLQLRNWLLFPAFSPPLYSLGRRWDKVGQKMGTSCFQPPLQSRGLETSVPLCTYTPHWQLTRTYAWRFFLPTGGWVDGGNK